MNEDLGAPEQWLQDHGDVLFRYALLQFRDEHRAEDAVQETLLAALQERDNFRGGASVRTWLIGILKHKVIDQFRREAREAPLTEDALRMAETDTDDSFKGDGHWRAKLSHWGNPDWALESERFWKILQHCLNGLPQMQSRLFMLREIFEEKSEKICKELKISPTNLWTMLYRARMGLRKCLDRNWVGNARE